MSTVSSKSVAWIISSANFLNCWARCSVDSERIITTSLLIPCAKWNMHPCSRASKLTSGFPPKCVRTDIQFEPWASETKMAGSNLSCICSRCDEIWNLATVTSISFQNNNIIPTDIFKLESNSIVAIVIRVFRTGWKKWAPTVIQNVPTILSKVISKWTAVL